MYRQLIRSRLQCLKIGKIIWPTDCFLAIPSGIRKRLLEKDECYPACSDISDTSITISSDLLSIEAHVDAHLDAAIPLPSHVKHWLPQEVMINDKPARGLLRKKTSYGCWFGRANIR
jgi:hypothetical protein